MKCNRLGKFGKRELHKCFVKNCDSIFFPDNNETCPKCNWKFCDNGHCGCSVSEETRKILDKFYDLFCEPHNYSEETKHALEIMLNTFYNFCYGCLK